MSSPAKPLEFVATEVGFADGLGGASNGQATAEYHYVLFGRQTDDQHPEYSGVYFEYDDQIHGAVDQVLAVTVAPDCVRFELRNGQAIVVRRGDMGEEWSAFVQGLYDTFGDMTILHQR